MRTLISIIISLIAAALFSGLASGYINSQTLSFQFSIPHAIACLATALAGLAAHILAGLTPTPGATNAPRTQHKQTDGRHHGKVKWFNPKKGFGFIACNNGDEVFVHYRNIEGTGRRILREGEVVTFVIVQSDKGPQAEDVRSDS